MTIAYAAINEALYERAAESADGAAVRALLGSFPPSFRLDDRANTKAVFQYDRLKQYAGAGVTLPWLVWRPGDVGGDSGQLIEISGSWWAYVAPGAEIKRLLDIRAALETLYGHTNAHAIDGGRVSVVFRGRAFEDRALSAVGMETRIVYRQRG